MTSQDIKAMYSMRDIVSRYGIHINRSGFCRCPFHIEKTASMKIYKDSYHCFGCGANGDIFAWVMQIDNLSFKEAYISLGGEEKLSFSTQRKIDRAKANRKKELERYNKANEELKCITTYITAYRNLLSEYEPFTDEHAYFYNKLQYQLYLLEQWG